MSPFTSRFRREHAPKDSSISMAAKSEPDTAPTPPPSSSSAKDEFFICERCMRPRATHRRLPYQKTKFFLCDYCYQPKSLKEVRDASIVFEMVWCRQGDHEAPVVNFKGDNNWSCYHCASRTASHPPKTPPEQSLRVRPDSELDLDLKYTREGKEAAAMAAVTGRRMKQQQKHPHLVPDQCRGQEERPQIRYYSGSYKPRGHFENSSRPPKTLQTYHPQVRLPNMANYIMKPSMSTPLQRLDRNTELQARARPQPQPQPQPKMHSVHGSRTYHEVPHPNQETPPRTQQRPSMAGRHERQVVPHDDILKTIPAFSEAVSANRTPKLKTQGLAHHHHKPQQQKRQSQNQRPPPQSPIALPPLVPSFESPAYHHQTHHSHEDLPLWQKQRPPQPPPPPPKRPRPKTQYDKPPAGPAWKLRERRLQEQRQKHKRRPTYGLRKSAATEEEEQARADSETLGLHTTCPSCKKHRPTFSELIEAYGFCFYCLRRHLVAAGELLKCPSCRRLQMRQDFMKYDSDGLVVEQCTAECMGCQWQHKKGGKLSAALCGGLT